MRRVGDPEMVILGGLIGDYWEFSDVKPKTGGVLKEHHIIRLRLFCVYCGRVLLRVFLLKRRYLYEYTPF